MKNKLFIGVLLICSCVSSQAQWVVTDPGNMAQGIANSIKQVLESSKIGGNTLSNFQETMKIYEQSKQYYDKLKQVNNLVKDGRKVQQTALMLYEITDIYVTNYSKMLADPNMSPQELEALGHGYNEILKEGSDMFSDLQTLVTPSALSMNDKERMEMVDQIYRNMRQHRAFADYYSRKFIGVSYVRSKQVGNSARIMELYGSSSDRYW